MNLFDVLRRKVDALLRRDRLDDELDDELRFHLEQQIAQLVEQGWEPAAARTEALRRFGGVEKFKEECRDERRVNLIDGVLQDLSYAARMLAKTKGFAALIIITLALGIGANTAIFSVVNGVLLAPLPYPQGDRLTLLEAHVPGIREEPINFSIKEFYELDAAAEGVELVEYHGMEFTLLGHGYPSNVSTGVVSHDFFDVLDVRAALGRTFLPSDEGPDAEAVLVLSDRYWREEFDADPAVVGSVFEMNDRPHRVIGVLPPLPQYPRYNDVYMPTSACPFRARGEEEMVEDRGAFRLLRVFGRRNPGVDAVRAADEVDRLTGAMAARNVDYYADSGYTVRARGLQEVLTENARPMLLILQGIVVLVLAVACANAANLMVARVMRRERELALRAAMGAGRGRLLRQLVTESTLLSLCGGALGLLFAGAGLGLLVDFAARLTARTDDIRINGSVLVFTLVVAAATGILFGVLPALWHRADAALTLREGGGPHATVGKRALRLRSGLIVAQVALSFVLLIGAGLMVRSLMKLARVDTGFAYENVLTANVYPNWTAYETAKDRIDMYSRLLRAMEGGPGVVKVAVSSSVPFSGSLFGEGVYQVDEPPPGLDEAVGPTEQKDSAGELQRGWPIELVPIGVSAEYFDTLGIALLEGRMLTPAELDGIGPPAALLSAAAARRYWPDSSPIGRRIAIPAPDSDGRDWVWHTVVGVVADAKHLGLERAAPAALFSSYRSFGGAGQLLVRTSADAQTMSAFIQQTLARVAPQQSVHDFQTYSRLRSASMATPRLIATLLSLFAGLALLITVVGIGGVVAHSVGLRRHEIGIRVALGARRGQVVGMVLWQGLAMVVIGLVAGALGALWLGGMVAPRLFETRPTDPLTFASVALVLLVATVVASLLPARRATSIDPVATLRCD
ncbi:MAG: ABC transporter permease [Acidobacteriota bacterium]|jgi:predicted permease